LVGVGIVVISGTKRCVVAEDVDTENGGGNRKVKPMMEMDGVGDLTVTSTFFWPVFKVKVKGCIKQIDVDSRIL